MFEENIKNFRTHLTSRGYPNNLVEKILSEVKFAERKNALTQKTESVINLVLHSKVQVTTPFYFFQ